MNETPEADKSPIAYAGDHSTARLKNGFLFIRLWPPLPAVEERSGPHWRHDSSLVGMLTDIVTANGGRTAGMYRAGLVAQFPETGSALNAAQQMQIATRGYSAFPAQSQTALAICVFSAAGVAGQHGDADELETAAVLAGAGRQEQILLTMAAYAETVKFLGRNPRSLSPYRSSSGSHPNLQAYELVSTEPKAGNGTRGQLENSPRTTSARTAGEEGAAGRTATARSPEAAPAHSGTGSAQPLPAVLVPDDDLPAEAGVSPKWYRQRWATHARTAAFVLLVAIAASVLTSRRDRSHVQPVQRTSVPSAAGNGVSPTAALTPAPAPPTPAPKTEELATPVDKPAPKLPPDSGASSSHVTTTMTTPPGVVPAPRREPGARGLEGRGDADGYSRNQIESLLERADRYYGDGKYDQSENLYNHVLSMDPRNASARAGLARIKLARAIPQ